MIEGFYKINYLISKLNYKADISFSDCLAFKNNT